MWAHRTLKLDTGQIEISAQKIIQELQYNITEVQRLVNNVESAISPNEPLDQRNILRPYVDALDEWASHMRDAFGTYELVVNGLAQGTQYMVTLDKRDLIALPPGEQPPKTN
jgi:hypothetical protein